MKITQESDYALRAVVNIAQRYPNKIEAKVIAEGCDIPLRFLLKLLRQLTTAKVIRSYRGINGGYALATNPEDITMAHVIEAIEGPIFLNKCIQDKELCSNNRKGKCNISMELRKIQESLLKELKLRKISDLL